MICKSGFMCNIMYVSFCQVPVLTELTALPVTVFMDTPEPHAMRYFDRFFFY